MDNMRDEFAKLKRHERHCNAAESRYWCEQYRLFAKRLLNEQAAQSVPVVGEPAAWLNECLLRLNHPVMPYVSINEPPSDKDWRVTPLYKAPTTSITAAELERLRRIEAVLVYVRSVLPMDTWADDCRRMIDAAIAGEKK